MYTVLFNSCRAPVEIANWLNGELALGNKFIACNGDFYIFEAVEPLRAADAAKACPECDGAVELCAMGHYVPSAPRT